jgi:hypothetical protein
MKYTSREVYEFISRQTNDPIVERKTCAVSWQSFAIYQSDLDFYDKISPTFAGQKFQIPAPTLCPEERQRRRLMFRNERKLYKRKCDFSNENLISAFSPDKIYKVYEENIWWSDKRDPYQSAIEIDFLKDFFIQIWALAINIPLPSRISSSNENSDYTNQAWTQRNCYLIFSAWNNEMCCYGNDIFGCSYCFDCLKIFKSEHCYECVDCTNCYKLYFSKNCDNCSNSYFLSDCLQCNNCFWCTNLNSKSFCLFNKSYSKEEYFEKISLYKSLSHSNMKDIWNIIQDTIEGSNRQQSKIFSSSKSSGNFIHNCKNTSLSYDVTGCDDIRYCCGINKSSSCMDYSIRWNNVNKIYESISIGNNSYAINFCDTCYDDINNLLYCRFCTQGVSNCFGCIWLHNNERYYILNKQYIKEEYELTVAKIITHMQSTGERWEFFHPSLSPFGYNETVAQEYFPLTKSEALARWYKRSDYNPDPVIPTWVETLQGDQIPNDISLVWDDILTKILICEVSKRPFKIQKSELEFYRTHHLPLPRKHPDIRHEERMRLRPWRTMFLRTCDKCDKEILSVYDRDYSWKVYCEKCYQKEVYS